MCRHNDSV